MCFLSHSAKHGCSKCLKLFSGVPGSMNYSGFDRAAWPVRTNTEHRTRVNLVGEFTTKVEHSRLESQLGCLYSILQRLPHFDAP